MSPVSGNIKDDPHSTIKSWVELYTDSLFAWACRRVENNSTAEDLVQETFLSAFQSIGKFKGESNPGTWLFSILNHKIIDHHRKKMRNAASPVKHSEPERFFDDNGSWRKEARPQPWHIDEAHLLDNTAFRDILDQCMKKLPDHWFSAVQLKYLEEKDSKDICQDLQLSPSNFWQILHRAKLQLRQCLEKHWFKKER